MPGEIHEAQAFKFHKLLGGNDEFKATEVLLCRWKSHRGIFEFSLVGESQSSDGKTAEDFPEIVHNIIEES